MTWPVFYLSGFRVRLGIVKTRDSGNADGCLPSYTNPLYFQRTWNSILWEAVLVFLHWLKHDIAFLPLCLCNSPLFLNYWTSSLFVCVHTTSRQRFQGAPWSGQSPRWQISGPMASGRRRKALSESIALVTKATRLLVSSTSVMLLLLLFSFSSIANMVQHCQKYREALYLWMLQL